jgi:hypothetical protein
MAVRKWCQSEIVHVLVGSEEHEDADIRQFRVLIDLLARRSRPIQVMLDGRFIESATELIKLPQTSVTTFQDFFVWAFSCAPQIDPAASLERVIDLAVFATLYEVFALQNQAVDVIRAKLGSSVWQLDPYVVKRFYQNAGEHTTLRHVIAAALGTIRKPPTLFGSNKMSSASSVGSSAIIARWRGHFEKDADLGADFFATTMRQWEGHDLLGDGAC